MNSQTKIEEQTPTSRPADGREIRALYQQILDGWNKRSAEAFGSAFTEDGATIGFDGSQYSGRGEIVSNLQPIFANHPTASYVAKVKTIRFLGADSAILGAIAGMVPPGKSDIDPKVNALQTVVAAKLEGKWRVALFQNTPAQFHGRPELVEQFTDELRQLL